MEVRASLSPYACVNCALNAKCNKSTNHSLLYIFFGSEYLSKKIFSSVLNWGVWILCEIRMNFVGEFYLFFNDYLFIIWSLILMFISVLGVWVHRYDYVLFRVGLWILCKFWVIFGLSYVWKCCLVNWFWRLQVVRVLFWLLYVLHLGAEPKGPREQVPW
jgi:hypothetical protein